MGGGGDKGRGKDQQEVPSSLLSSQAGDDSLSWKQKAKQGHCKAHPDRQVLSLVPHELQGDRKKDKKVLASRRVMLTTLNFHMDIKWSECLISIAMLLTLSSAEKIFSQIYCIFVFSHLFITGF